ncbi:hypothetical protein [Nonomuraea angiospora]|uniref:hypothetical protein n=1 Tax=Nonomuraea angiospora TaxID=46172 RepID=UPI0029BCE9FC|nr:hypothetical protein [Nonomuraea angiospora]MDX3110176.1 hypothetical protein [Nonomuraea angiospora]
MLPKFEYADFNKFLVSVGALLIAAGLAIPIFLLQEKTVAGTPEKNIRELTPTGKQIFSAQQEQIRWLLSSWPYISGGLAVAGLLLITWGGFKWWQRQKHLVLREEAELGKLKAEKEKLDAEKEKLDEEVAQIVKAKLESPEEASESVERKAEEVVEEVSVDQHATSVNGQASPPQPRSEVSANIARNARASITRHYVEAEDAAAKLVTRLMGRDGEAFQNIKLGKAARVDAVAIGPRLNLGIDVKLLTESNWRLNVRKRVLDALKFSLDMQNLSKKEYGRRLRPLIVWALHAEPGAVVEDDVLHAAAHRLAAEFEPHLRTFEEPPLFLIADSQKLQDLPDASDQDIRIIENWARGPRSFILTVPSEGAYSAMTPLTA